MKKPRSFDKIDKQQNSFRTKEIVFLNNKMWSLSSLGLPKESVILIMHYSKYKLFLENLNEPNYIWYKSFMINKEKQTYDSSLNYKDLFIWYLNFHTCKPRIFLGNPLLSFFKYNNWNYEQIRLPNKVRINNQNKRYSDEELFARDFNITDTFISINPGLEGHSSIYFRKSNNELLVQEVFDYLKSLNLIKNYKFKDFKVIPNIHGIGKEFLWDYNGDIFITRTYDLMVEDNKIKEFKPFVIERYPVNVWNELLNSKGNAMKVVFRHLSTYWTFNKPLIKELFISVLNNTFTIYIDKFLYNQVYFFIVIIVIKSLVIYKHDRSIPIHKAFAKIPFCFWNNPMTYENIYNDRDNYETFSVTNSSCNNVQEYCSEILNNLPEISLERTLFISNIEALFYSISRSII